MKLNLDKIKKELGRIGWTNYSLAKKMGCSPQWVYQVLSPSYGGVTLRTVTAIADALEMDPKDLLI